MQAVVFSEVMPQAYDLLLALLAALLGEEIHQRHQTADSLMQLLILREFSPQIL